MCVISATIHDKFSKKKKKEKNEMKQNKNKLTFHVWYAFKTLV